MLPLAIGMYLCSTLFHKRGCLLFAMDLQRQLNQSQPSGSEVSYCLAVIQDILISVFLRILYKYDFDGIVSHIPHPASQSSSVPLRFFQKVCSVFGPGAIFKQCPVQPDTDFSNLHVQVISLLNCCIAELIETTESIPAGCLSLGGPSEGWIFFFRIERGYQHKIPPLKKFPSPPLCTP